VCILWGTGYLAIRIGAQEAPPFLFAGLRIFGAGAVLTGGLLVFGQHLPRRRDQVPLAVMGIITEGLANGVLAWSARWVPSGLMALLVAMVPFWMIGIEAVLPGGERMTPRTLAGMVLGFGGLIWLLAPQLHGLAFDSGLVTGCLLLQGACLGYAGGSLYWRRRRLQVAPLMGAGLQMLYAGGALCMVGVLAGEVSRFSLPPRALISFLYLLFIPSLIGFSAYVYALQRLPVAVVSLHRYLNPVVALLLGFLVLHEPFVLPQAAAIGVIFAGVVLIQTARRPARKMRSYEFSD
jgi:drug/metabolite transporter (DMT)-like permease